MGCCGSSKKLDLSHVHEFEPVDNDDEDVWRTIGKRGCNNCGAKSKPESGDAYYECLCCDHSPILCRTCYEAFNERQAERSRNAEELQRLRQSDAEYDTGQAEVAERVLVDVGVRRSAPTSAAAAAPLRVVVKPYGVLGSQLLKAGGTAQRAPEPDADVAFVDPAGLNYIQGSPSGAGGASGVVYRWLGISSDASFPADVSQAIWRPLQAKFHAYGEKKCVHVVGPNFSTEPCPRPEAVQQLSLAYRSVLTEFAASGLQTLRLLPISGGIFAGSFQRELPQLTAEALEQGFADLGPDLQVQVARGKNLEMCIFLEKEFDDFVQAFSKAGCFDGSPSARGSAPLAMASGDGAARLSDIYGDAASRLRAPVGRQPQAMRATGAKIVPTSKVVPRCTAGRAGRRTIPAGAQIKPRMARQAPVVKQVRQVRQVKPAKPPSMREPKLSPEARSASLGRPKAFALQSPEAFALQKEPQPDRQALRAQLLSGYDWGTAAPSPVPLARHPGHPATAATSLDDTNEAVTETALFRKFEPRPPPVGPLMCKFRCGCAAASGTTRSGKPMDTCCRACGKSRGKSGEHDASCPGPSHRAPP